MGFLSSLTTLDIKSPNRSLFNVSSREFDNLTYDYITPKFSNRVKRVVCGDKVIWERRSLEHVDVFVRYHSGVMCFAYVCDGTHYDHYFINDRGDFEPLDRAQYIKRTNELSRSVPVKDYITIELTIRESTEAIQVVKTGGPPPILFTAPKIGYICKRVTYEGVTIWEAKEDTERCIKIMLHTSENPFMCHLMVSMGDDRKELCYIKKNDGWVAIDKETYDAIWNKSKTESEPPVRHPLQEKLIERVTGIILDKLKSL